MEKKEAKDIILKMSEKELIETINADIDDFAYPLGQIHSVFDEDFWDKVSDKYGAYFVFMSGVDIPSGYNPKYVSCDEDRLILNFFKDKEEIIDYFGLDNIAENLINQ